MKTKEKSRKEKRKASNKSFQRSNREKKEHESIFIAQP
jgi:hypothetical protein